MADDLTLNNGSGGATLAADDIAGVHHQRVKVQHGADGSATDVSTASPLPVVQTGTHNVTINAALPAGTANIGDVDVLTLPALPAGTNNIGDVDVLSIAAGDNNIGNVDVVTLPALPAGTNNIGDVDVLTLPALPAGTNNIGDVDVLTLPALPAGTNNIGDVDVLTMPATFAEDAAHTTADLGVQILAVRRDADTSLVSADNDYAPLQVNAAGSLKVAITAGAGSGGTSIADGATFTRNTTSITPAGAAVEASAPTLTDTDVAALSMTTAGALRVAVTAGGVAGVVEDAAAAGGEEGIMVLAVRRDAASSGVSADGDFAALSVTSDGSLRVSGGGGGTQFAEDTPHTTADVGTVALAVRRDTAAVGSGADGDYSTLNVDASGRLHVNVGNTVTVGSHAVTNAGTFVTQVDGAALTALQLIDNPVVVDDAAFTPATSSVMMAGFQADEASVDSVDEGDAGAARMSLDRKQYVISHVETSRIYQNGTPRTPVNLIIDAATSGDNTLLAAQGAGNIIRVHQLMLVASAAVTVRFESGAGGTALSGQMQLAANTGFVLPFSPTGWFETAANALLNLELSGAVSVDGLLQYTVVT